MRPIATLVALLLLLSTVDCTSKSCTAMGCTDSATGKFTVPATPQDLVASVVKVCRNGACSTGTPAPPATCVGATCPTGLDLRMTGPLTLDVFLTARGTTQYDREIDATVPAVTAQTTSFDLDVQVTSGPFQDGDTYEVTVGKPGSPPSVSIQKTATYATNYPNGPSCSGQCRVATLD